MKNYKNRREKKLGRLTLIEIAALCEVSTSILIYACVASQSIGLSTPLFGCLC